MYLLPTSKNKKPLKIRWLQPGISFALIIVWRNTPISEARRSYYERRKRLGLCVQCSRKAATGFVSCRICLERGRKQHMERNPLFCGECKKLIQPEDRNRNRFHKLCAEKRLSRRYPQQHRSAVIAYQERHRRRRLCCSCPRKAFKGSLCRRHYGMVLERYYNRAAS